MATRLDPTATTTLVRAFARDIGQRLRVLKKEVVRLIETEDALGLTAPLQHLQVFNAEKGVWRFHTDDQKVQAFQKWLQGKVDEKLLSTDAKGKPWTGKYVESAYKKGLVRAYIDSKGKDLTKQSDFFKGTKAQFLKTAFNQPEMLSKVKLLATRSFEELRGISAQMSTQLNRILANGLVQGKNPKAIAREMADSVDGLSKARALRIARTEIIHAHAEGQLDAFEDLGIEQVGALAEWQTAGDDKVCEECDALEGAVFTIDEARGLIPRHPNCRCAWVPYEESASRQRVRSTLSKVKKSLKARGKSQRQSSWAGKSLVQKLQRKQKKGKGRR